MGKDRRRKRRERQEERRARARAAAAAGRRNSFGSDADLAFDAPPLDDCPPAAAFDDPDHGDGDDPGNYGEAGDGGGDDYPDPEAFESEYDANSYAAPPSMDELEYDPDVENDPAAPPVKEVRRAGRGLQLLCDAASEADPASWDAVRRYLSEASPEDARCAAERRGDYGTAPLHLACRNGPPLDVVIALLTASPGTVGWADSFGWLPLHYACANEASEDVVLLLAEQYPPSKTAVDKRRRTPLHFALGHTDRPASVPTVVLLSGSGAALMPDENGMLPLHYACAYGATEEGLRILIDDHAETIAAVDHRGRTPLHFALGNADRPASPGVVALLLSRSPSAVNAVDAQGNLPLHLLATRVQALKRSGTEEEAKKCAHCEACFESYLNARPRATADLLTALQSLPHWIRDTAVLNPVVQNMLNVKIAKRLPTVVIMLDLIFYLSVSWGHMDAVVTSVRQRKYMESDESLADQSLADQSLTPWLVMLYLSASWFLFREILQASSLMTMGLISTWITDPDNWLDLVYISIIYTWTSVMATQALDDVFFQRCSAILVLVYTWKLLSFLKSILFGFAVFIGGISFVMRRLMAFSLSLIIILVAFALIFSTLFRMSEGCKDYATDPYGVLLAEQFTYGVYAPVYAYVDPCDGAADAGDPSSDPLGECRYVTSCEPTLGGSIPFCSQLTSWTKMWYMLSGSVDEKFFHDRLGNRLATVYFAIFMFLCVIVLANVLIAIVTDSWAVIQNERSALVFWSNRLDFVAEVDLIASNIFRMKRREDNIDLYDEDDVLRELWKKLMYIFDDDLEERFLTVAAIVFKIGGRAVAACVIVPLWILSGLVTFGFTWPPQVREKLLMVQPTVKSQINSEEQTRLDDVTQLREDLTAFGAEARTEMEEGRDELYIIRAVLDTAKTEIHAEMNNVKEIVTDLFELLSVGESG